jgi:hypothetical protein
MSEARKGTVPESSNFRTNALGRFATRALARCQDQSRVRGSKRKTILIFRYYQDPGVKHATVLVDRLVKKSCWFGSRSGRVEQKIHVPLPYGARITVRSARVMSTSAESLFMQQDAVKLVPVPAGLIKIRAETP